MLLYFQMTNIYSHLPGMQCRPIFKIVFCEAQKVFVIFATQHSLVQKAWAALICWFSRRNFATFSQQTTVTVRMLAHPVSMFHNIYQICLQTLLSWTTMFGWGKYVLFINTFSPCNLPLHIMIWDIDLIIPSCQSVTYS